MNSIKDSPTLSVLMPFFFVKLINISVVSLSISIHRCYTEFDRIIAIIMKVHDCNPQHTYIKRGLTFMFYREFRGKLHICIVSDISAFSISIYNLVSHEGIISRNKNNKCEGEKV